MNTPGIVSALALSSPLCDGTDSTATGTPGAGAAASAPSAGPAPVAEGLAHTERSTTATVSPRWTLTAELQRGSLGEGQHSPSAVPAGRVPAKTRRFRHRVESLAKHFVTPRAVVLLAPLRRLPTRRTAATARCPASGWGVSRACCRPGTVSIQCSVCDQVVETVASTTYGDAVRFIVAHDDAVSETPKPRCVEREGQPSSPGRPWVMRCTWDSTCPHEGARRMERRVVGAVSLVEFVCDEHVASAEAHGYALDPPSPPSRRNITMGLPPVPRRGCDA